MTNKERQALAEDIVEHLVDCGAADVEVVERLTAWTVARLAALTAPQQEPRKAFRCVSCKYEMFDEHPSSCDCGSSEYQQFEVYTVPPAPVVKAVKLPEVEKWRSVDAVRAQNAYRVLVAQAIRATGQEVENE